MELFESLSNDESVTGAHRHKDFGTGGGDAVQLKFPHMHNTVLVCIPHPVGVVVYYAFAPDPKSTPEFN